MDIPKEKLLSMYERMITIRQFEERVRQIFRTGVMPGFVHLYAGQEAMAVGVCVLCDTASMPEPFARV